MRKRQREIEKEKTRKNERKIESEIERLSAHEKERAKE